MPPRESPRTTSERERLAQVCRALVEALGVVDPKLSKLFAAALPAFEPEKRWPLAGLRMGIRDMLEMTDAFSRDQLAGFENRLSELSFSLATIRCEFLGKQVGAVLKRGRIRNDEEYYLLKGFSEDMDPPPARASTTEAARRLVAQYELALRK